MIQLKILWDILSSKLGFITIGMLAVVLGGFCVHSNGYKKGVQAEKVRQEKNYQDKLSAAITQNALEQKEVFDKAIEFAKSQKKLEIVYKDRVKTVEKIVYESKEISNPDCKMLEDTRININKQMEEPNE